MNYEEAYAKLSEAGQLHLLQYYKELSDEKKEALLNEIALTDFSALALSSNTEAPKRGCISPIRAMQFDEIRQKHSEFEATGIRTIQQEKVGAVLLAGGMGTRLGSDQPKGMYNIGLTRDVYIFERLIQNLLDVVEQTGSFIHLFIMTSDKNHDATTRFFEEQNYFGYKRTFVHFFQQEMAPACDYEGRAYMEEKWKIATSPNGNGGWFSSMIKGGMLDIVKENGIEWLNVFAVDNVLQRIADPVFIGAVLKGGYHCGSKVIRKTSPDEKVGVMCLEDNRPSIVEYYELTPQMHDETDENGEPAYNFGVILNYLFEVAPLEAIAKEQLPLHRASKKIPYIDAHGNHIQPEEPNGYKFETFILDMIYLLNNCLPFEVVREHEFAPIKNKTGVDSVESARQLLQKNGIEL